MDSQVFKDVKFFVIHSANKEVVELLKSLGAVSHPLLSESVRFAISDDPCLAEVGEAEELYAVPVVTSEWVKLSVEAQKFLPFKPFHPEFKKIFAGLVVTLSGLSLSDRLTIWAHVVIHGGKMQHVLDKSVTHVVLAKADGIFYDYCTTKLEPNKPVLVTPDWIMDCITNQTLLPCELYHPNLLIRPIIPNKTIIKQRSVNDATDANLTGLLLLTDNSIKQEEPETKLNNSNLTTDNIVVGTSKLVLSQQQSNLPKPLLQTNPVQLMLSIPPPNSKSGTNMQTPTSGVTTVQHLNIKPVEQKNMYDGVVPASSKSSRGGHARGGGSSSRGGHSSKKATQDQIRLSQQQQQQRLPHSPVNPNRFPSLPAGTQRFPQGRPQRMPTGSPMVGDSTGQHGFVHPNDNSVNVVNLPGINVANNSEVLSIPNQLLTNYPTAATITISGTITNNGNAIITSSNDNTSNTNLPSTTHSFVLMTNTITPTPNTTTTTTTTSSSSGTYHSSKTSKSKSSKHVQEQNLNEEEKDAIVMQNVKNILSLQHTWNRDSSHGRNNASSTNSVDSNNNSGTGSAGLVTSAGGACSSNLGNLVGSGFNGPSNFSGNQTSGTHRKPKSPKSPCRIGTSSGSSGSGHKASPKSPKNTKVNTITKVLSSPQQQQQQQHLNQQQPSIVMAGSTLPSVLLTSNLQQMQYRPSSNNLNPNAPPTQLQRPSNMQHYLTTATLAPHHQQQQQQQSVSGPGTPAYIFQRHPCAQLVASVSQQSTHTQLHPQSFSVHNPYQRTGGILTAVNSPNLGTSQHLIQQPTQQAIQQQSSIPHHFQQTQIQQPTLYVRTTRQAYQHMGENVDTHSDMTIIGSDSNGDLLVTNGVANQLTTINNVGQPSNPSSLSSSSSHFYQSNQAHIKDHQPPQQQGQIQHKQIANSQASNQSIAQQLLLQSNGNQLIQIKSSGASHYSQALLAENSNSIALAGALNENTNIGFVNRIQQVGQSIPNISSSPSSSQPSVQLQIALHPTQTVNHSLKPNLQTPSHQPSPGKISPAQISQSPRQPSQINRPYMQNQQYPAQVALHAQQSSQQQQLQHQQQQQKVQLSVATPYQTLHGYTQNHSQPQQSQQQPQQIIFQSPLGQQIIATHHQPLPAGVVKNSNNQPANGTGTSGAGVLLRSVLPNSANAVTSLGTPMAPNQPLVTLSTNQSGQVQLVNRGPPSATAAGMSKVVFHSNPTSPPPPISNNNTNNNHLSGHHIQPQSGQQPPQQHQQQHAFAQQIQTGTIISNQPKPNHIAYAQPVIRPNNGLNINESSTNIASYASNPINNSNSNNSNNINHHHNNENPTNPRPTHSQLIQISSHNNQVTNQTGQTRLTQTSIPIPVQNHNRQISPNTSSSISHSATPNTNNVPITSVFPISPNYYGHEGNPLPSRSEECLIGCVLLILGYRGVPETQKLLWRRIIRSHGAEVILVYDPNRVTHVVIDCQLEEPDIVKQALIDRKRLVTIYWVNDVLANGKMIPPFEILHLPSPFSNDITFSFIRAQLISLTGFEGKERQKVEVMIRQIGATFTDYLEPSNTLLVCKQPSGKKYEMAQLWDIPCVNVRWLQDLYFGDLSTLSMALPHKYLCFETSDVTTSLERCTPRVQDLMIGWQSPIRLTQEVWIHSNKLSNDFADEERERKRKLEVDCVNQSKIKKPKCILTPLNENDIKLAMSCQSRYEALIQEAEQNKHLLAVAEATVLARQLEEEQQQQQQQNSQKENGETSEDNRSLIPTIKDQIIDTNQVMFSNSTTATTTSTINPTTTSNNNNIISIENSQQEIQQQEQSEPIQSIDLGLVKNNVEIKQESTQPVSFKHANSDIGGEDYVDDVDDDENDVTAATKTTDCELNSTEINNQLINNSKENNENSTISDIIESADKQAVDNNYKNIEETQNQLSHPITSINTTTADKTSNIITCTRQPENTTETVTIANQCEPKIFKSDINSINNVESHESILTTTVHESNSMHSLQNNNTKQFITDSFTCKNNLTNGESDLENLNKISTNNDKQFSEPNNDNDSQNKSDINTDAVHSNSNSENTIHESHLTDNLIRKRQASPSNNDSIDSKRRAITTQNYENNYEFSNDNIEQNVTDSTQITANGNQVMSDNSLSSAKIQNTKELVNDEKSLMNITKIQPKTMTTTDSNKLSKSDETIIVQTDVHITFTAIDMESRQALIELCTQLPQCKIVETAEEATHLIANRLIRTPKTYMAIAMGCFIVTPKWIQASILRGYWLDETPWLLSDADAEAQLGISLSNSITLARKRKMLGPSAGLFAGLEFWLSPGACHRDICINLIKAGGGIVRQKRPTQKMALLSQPKQLIICHEDDSHVASYLMRTKTGNKAVHHEEFILSGTLRQELDYEAYQIQYVNTLQDTLKAVVAAATAALAHPNNNNTSTITTTTAATITTTSNNNNSTGNLSNYAYMANNLPPSLRYTPITTSMNYMNLIENTIMARKYPKSDLNTTNLSTTTTTVARTSLPVCLTATNTNITSTVTTTSTTTTTNNNNNNNNNNNTMSTALVNTNLFENLSTGNSKLYKQIIPSCTIGTGASTNITTMKPTINLISQSSNLLNYSTTTAISTTLSSSPFIFDKSLNAAVSNFNQVNSANTVTNIPSSSAQNSYCSVVENHPINAKLSYCLNQNLDYTKSSTKLISPVDINLVNSTGTTNLNYLLSKSITDPIQNDCLSVSKASLTNSLLPSSSPLSSLSSTSCLYEIPYGPKLVSNTDQFPLNSPVSSIGANLSSTQQPLTSQQQVKRLNTQHATNSLILTGSISEAFLTSVPIICQESRQTITSRPVTALTAMIVAAESVVGDLINPLPLPENTDDSVSSFLIPKSSGYCGQIANSNLNARIAAADAHAVATATAAAANALNSGTSSSSSSSGGISNNNNNSNNNTNNNSNSTASTTINNNNSSIDNNKSNLKISIPLPINPSTIGIRSQLPQLQSQSIIASSPSSQHITLVPTLFTTHLIESSNQVAVSVNIISTSTNTTLPNISTDCNVSSSANNNTTTTCITNFTPIVNIITSSSVSTTNIPQIPVQYTPISNTTSIDSISDLINDQPQQQLFSTNITSNNHLTEENNTYTIPLLPTTTVASIIKESLNSDLLNPVNSNSCTEPCPLASSVSSPNCSVSNFPNNPQILSVQLSTSPPLVVIPASIPFNSSHSLTSLSCPTTITTNTPINATQIEIKDIQIANNVSINEITSASYPHPDRFMYITNKSSELNDLNILNQDLPNSNSLHNINIAVESCSTNVDISNTELSAVSQASVIATTASEVNIDLIESNNNTN